MPLTEKCRMASFIIDNSGTQEMMEKQIADIHRKFKRSRAHWPLRIVGWSSLAFLLWITLKILAVVF